ncbi:alpha/beta hydrolase [Bosea sp. Root381]|uniref:alpha/beta fold hydrolase n=1 Tax=Bosea sp. Root381 TaxID=1736524 RepID=UPI0006FDE3E8|nr:alpha/beta fold hydrolase [Bosea sp. Root381]KRD99964.1 alpha/beta hydrolase [Bosea sp. Root381]
MSVAISAAPDGAFTARTPDGAVLQAFSEGEGPALLLVSGLGGTAGFWAGNATTLARSFRVIRFDQRGIGASSRGTAPCTIDQLARDCLAVLDAAGVERAVLLGHSTGGCIGQALGRIGPERLDGLILSATWLKQSRYLSGFFQARRTMLDDNPQAYAATAVLIAYPPAWLEANWAVYEAALATAPSTAAECAVVRERIDGLLSFDGSAEIAALPMPTLVLGARDDMIVPSFMQDQLATALPGARKILLDSGGHFFPISRPDAFTAKIVEWVGELR